MRATNTDPRRPRGGLRTANRRIPLAWLPSDAPAPQWREAAKTFMGRGDGVLVGGRTLEEESRRYWTTTPAGFHSRDHGLTIERREPKNYRFHPQVLAASVSLDHERPERSSNPLTGASALCGYEQIASVVNFFGYVLSLSPRAQERVSSHFHLLTAHVVLPRRPTRIATVARSTVGNNLQQICSSLLRQPKCIPRLTKPIQPTSAWFQH